MYKILVIDDEKDIVDMVETFLINFNYKIIKGYSTFDALALIDETTDLLLLDISLNEDTDAGINICRKIRETYNIPIIFLSAKTSSIDRIKGFNVGADDYITKPFDLMLLASRIKAHLRRVNEYDSKESDILNAKGITLNTNSKRVFINKEEIILSKNEYKLLFFLLSNKNIILNKQEILLEVWGSNHYDLNTVTTSIMRLRKKLNSNYEKYIKTVHGRGYILES
ncbi:response regulator transcription factor [Clostridiaceae bacterium HSG29]|nr:response regulator transcription factor [Clostridiaceae bacterium HSG29]